MKLATYVGEGLTMKQISFVFLSFLLVAAAAPAIAEQPDFSGTWVLDAEASDDVEAEFRRWMQTRRVRAPGGPGGLGAGRGAGGARGAPGVDAGDRAGFGGAGAGGGRGLLGMMQAFLAGTQRLEIEHRDPVLTITTANGQARSVFTDGRLIEREEENGGKTKVKTKWKKDRVVVDVQFPPRPNPLGGTLTPNLTQTYDLDKEGRLELATTVGLGAGTPPFTVERIYERQE